MTNSSIIQGTGIGHNISAGDNSDINIGDIIITSLSSSDLVACAKQFLHAITHRDWKTANTYLTSLNSVGSIDAECKSLLEILQYKLLITQGKDANIKQQLFIELLRSPRSNSIIKDIVESIYIHYLSLSSNSDARNRYYNSQHKGSFAAEIFYEKIASKEELVQLSSQSISDLFEHELCSLVRCAIRCEDFQLAINFSKELINRYPNSNSEILLYLSKSYQIHKLVNGNHFWLIDSKLMKELEEQIIKTLELAKSSDDFRVVHTAAILLASTQFQASELIDFCSKNIEEAKKLIPNISSVLPSTDKYTNSSISPRLILKQEDLKITEEDFSQISYAVEKGDITNREIERWLDNGGDVIASDEKTIKFIYLSLYAITCDPENTPQKIALSEKFEHFLEKNSENLISFNVFAIHQLCKNLRRAGLPLFAVKLIEPLLPASPWCSPILGVYAEALLDSDQLEKLDDLLEKIEGVKENYRFMAIKIERAISSENFPKAIQLTEHALAKYPNSCYYWRVLLRSLHLSNVSPEELAITISKIPKKIIETYSYEGLTLLHLIAKTDLPLAESVMLEWFIDEPVGMAINVTNLHFNNLHLSEYPVDIKYPSERCSIAVVYRSGNRTFTKLLVDGCGHSEYLLDTDTPLGKNLKDADVGDKIELGMTTYQVIERLPPIVGAFRISVNIRNDINPGSDCFYQLWFEEDNVEDLLNQIGAISQKKQIIDAEIDGQTIPLLMRLHETHQNDLIRGSFLYLIDKNSNSNLRLYSDGEIIKESVVLDALSLAYLSLTGFCHGLIRKGIKLYITRETKEIVSDWLEQTGRADYFSISKSEQGFLKTTADDIAKDASFNNLQLLYGKCELISSQSIDMPEMITKVRDTLDISHYSSLKASMSHSIPFLCLDSMFCSLYRQLDIPLANVSQFMNDACTATKTAESRHAECHIQYGLTVPIMHRDVVELCSQKEKGQYLAAKILKMYPNNYPSTDTALQVLTECCLKSICSAYIELKGQRSFFEWRYTEHVVYACSESSMLCLEGDTCEQRLARLISEVFKILGSASNITNFALILFRQFVQGHFLDSHQIDVELRKLLAIEDSKEI
ncbi:TPA: hypothetical protein ACGGS2_002628 [Vibrio cholerae]|nr:hypothetical protein [Vibrio cholerae]EKF9731030.1 hypothetical protein [Vibrio cholerae]